MTGGVTVDELREIYSAQRAELTQIRALIDEAISGHGQIVAGMLSQLTLAGGKMFRPVLVLLAGRACGEIGRTHVSLAAVVEMIHQAALVHDDILDQAEVRHGLPSANMALGNSRAVMIGDLLVAHAFKVCGRLEDGRFVPRLAQTVVELCEGETEQIVHRGRWDITMDEYLRVADLKTASLIGACAAFGAEAAGADEAAVDALGRYGRNVGMAFQIADDLLDLVGREETVGKTLGRDLAGGDLTFPVIDYLGGDPGRVDQVRRVAEGSAEGRTRLANALRRAGSLDRADDVAREHIERAMAALESVAPSAARDDLAVLAQYVPGRVK